MFVIFAGKEPSEFLGSYTQGYRSGFEQGYKEAGILAHRRMRPGTPNVAAAQCKRSAVVAIGN